MATSANQHELQQCRLVTVIRGGAATSANKDFVKTEHHHVFLGGVDYYDVWHLPFYEPIVWLLYVAICCNEMLWGQWLVRHCTGIFEAGTQPAAVDKNLGDSARVISNKTYGSRALIKLFMGRRL